MNRLLRKFTFSPEIVDVIENCKGIFIPTTKQELYDMVFGTGRSGKYDVVYDVPGQGVITEATVVRAKNGVVVNYVEDYMRRRDPDCMRIGDDKPTDKPRFSDVYGFPFADMKKETLEWLKSQELIFMPFNSGGNIYGYGSMLICPRNAAFFAFAMAHLQGFVSAEDTEGYTPRAIVYVAPPFRHTHFNGKQVVVHNRLDNCHEVFSYNLYPGPSAKKGVYSVLLDIGEQEGWVTAHASCALMTTEYDNDLVIMHEGASGGGKSEMLQDIARREDGRERAALLLQHPGHGRRDQPDLGAHAGLQRQALPEPARHCPARHGAAYCHRTGGGRYPLLWYPYAPVHPRQPELWHHGHAALYSAGTGLDVAPGCAARV